jgi:hypothetical protein
MLGNKCTNPKLVMLESLFLTILSSFICVLRDIVNAKVVYPHTHTYNNIVYGPS